MLEPVLTFFEKAINTNEKIIILSTDVSHKKMRQLKKVFPQKVIDVGIAEQTVFGVAAGLSLKGYIPVIFGPSAFMLTRGYEQVKNNLVLQGLNAIIVGFGSGLAWLDYGATHCGIDDISLANAMNGVVSWIPYSETNCLEILSNILKTRGIHYIKLGEQINSMDMKTIDYKTFATISMSKTLDYLLIFVGNVIQDYGDLIDGIKENKNNITIICLYTSLFLQDQYFFQLAQSYKKILIVEQNVYSGSISSLLHHYMHGNGYKGNIRTFCLQHQIGKTQTKLEEMILQGMAPKNILEQLSNP